MFLPSFIITITDKKITLCFKLFVLFLINKLPLKKKKRNAKFYYLVVFFFIIEKTLITFEDKVK